MAAQHKCLALLVVLLAVAVATQPAAARVLYSSLGDFGQQSVSQHPTEGTAMTIEVAQPKTGAAAEAEVQLAALDEVVVRAAATPSPSPPPPVKPPILDTNQPAPWPETVMANPLNCSGFAQPRTYIEGQAWFTPELPGVPDAVSTNSMHLHVGACVPHRQWVAGVVKLAILVQRHGYNLPDVTPVNLRVEVEQTSSTGTTVRMTTYGQIRNNNWACDNATDLSTLCKQVFYMDVQTSTWNATAMEGLNVMRLIGSTPINDTVGTRSIETRINSNFVLWNNQAMTLTTPAGLKNTLAPAQLSTTGFPWGYTHAEYLNEIALTPFVGNMTFKASSFSLTNTANVTGLFISIDPGFHLTPVVPGFVIRNYTADQLPNRECPIYMNGNVSHVDCRNISSLTFDTRQLADAKWHKLFLRTDAFLSNSDPLITTRTPRVGAGTFSAVALIAFRVNNTGAAPPNPVPGNATPGVVTSPPSDFTPPPGVTVFDGSQLLPDTNATLNIGANNYNCSGWLEPRVYLEGGAWHAQLDQAVDYGNGSQLLIGACLPHGQRVAGKIPVDILLQKRNFPNDSGINLALSVRLDWSGGNITYRLTQTSKLQNWTCATPGNCRTIISIQVDTKPSSGAYIAPDGPNAVTLEASTFFNYTASSKTLLARVNSWLFVTNNLDTNTSIPLNTTGSAKLDYPWGPGDFKAVFTKLPPLFAPVNGTIPVGFTNSGPVNLTNMVLAVDPMFGPVLDFGLLMFNGSRWTNKTICTDYKSCKGTINLDTTKLCNGVHRLMARQDSYVLPPPSLAQYGSGTFSTSNMLTFTVANAVEAAGCRPSTAATAAAARTASMRAGRVTGHVAAANRANRAARLAPERVVMAAQPRVIQELEVVGYNPARKP